MSARNYENSLLGKFLDETPRSIRIAQYPCGERRIQGAYYWSQGTEGGIDWMDIPIVKVNIQGKAIPE